MPRVKTRIGSIIEPIDKTDVGNIYKNKKKINAKQNNK